jgi:hypothetical protein
MAMSRFLLCVELPHGTISQIESSHKMKMVSTQLMLDEAKLSNWNVSLSPVADYIPESWNDTSGAQYVTRTNPFNGGTDVLLCCRFSL